MRKLKLFISVCLAIVMATSFAYAGLNNVDVTHENFFNEGGYFGPTGINPPAFGIKVRQTSFDTAALVSGDVVVWNFNRAEGYTVAKLSSDTDHYKYAGVMLTAASTDGSTTALSDSLANGLMATRGLCYAKIDVSASTDGEPLVVNGGTLAGSFATRAVAATDIVVLSRDIGILLSEPAADGLGLVYLW